MDYLSGSSISNSSIQINADRFSGFLLSCGLHVKKFCLILYRIHFHFIPPSFHSSFPAPCASQNVSVSLQCASNTASVAWTLSPGAIGYNVTALGRDGDVRYCRTSNTYCQIPNMHCSQTYNFVVTPFSDMCSGWPSSAFTFTAGMYTREWVSQHHYNFRLRSQ